MPCAPPSCAGRLPPMLDHDQTLVAAVADTICLIKRACGIGCGTVSPSQADHSAQPVGGAPKCGNCAHTGTGTPCHHGEIIPEGGCLGWASAQSVIDAAVAWREHDEDQNAQPGCGCLERLAAPERPEGGAVTDRDARGMMRVLWYATPI
jgi:hypothetical protein